MKMSVSGTQNQANFRNDQTYNIDIRKLYNDVVSSIDQIRSHVSISKSATVLASMIAALSAGNTDPYVWIQQFVTDPNNPQETRCSAFFRLIGLPVIAPNGLYFSPGYDINTNTKIDLANVNKLHLNVMNNIYKDKPALFDLMNARETYVNSMSSIFSLSNQSSNLPNINASVLALSSVANGRIRKFAASFGSPDPLNTSITSQAYTVGAVAAQNQTNSAGTAFLNQYLDATGNFPTTVFNNIQPVQQPPIYQRVHLIRPLITDPRVNLSINPPNGLVCAPFATDKSKTLYAENIYLTRPYIDTICSYRCNIYQNQTNQTSGQGTQSDVYQQIQSFIQNTSTMRNQDLLANLASTPAAAMTLADQEIIKYVNIMNSMVNILWDSIHSIKDAEAQTTGHQWIPITDIKGPEYGMTTPDVFLISDNTGTRLDPIIIANYPKDQAIATLSVQQQLQNVNSQVQEPDLGNFAFQGIQTMPDTKATQAFGSRPQNALDDIVKSRNKVCSDAASALQTIEMIMGEFSGFGLCDIVAIFAALWTIDEQTLVYMIDDKAFQRLYINPNLRDKVVEARYAANQQGKGELTGTDVLNNFDKQVRQMYILMDKLFANVSQSNTSSGS